jgi:hypothetical protein
LRWKRAKVTNTSKNRKDEQERAVDELNEACLARWEEVCGCFSLRPEQS